jgi:site-specific recombinase XerD
MSRKKLKQSPKRVLRLPDLDFAKSAVLNTLRSPESKRSYRFAIDDFVAWYCSEPWRLSSSTINLRLAAVRRLAYEAADTGLLSPELAAGIGRVKGAKRVGVRLGNWLSAEEVKQLLRSPDLDVMKGKRDRAIIAVLAGCGLRRSEVAQLSLSDIQKRDERWVIVDLYGKGGHIRTVPLPAWVKSAIDCWTTAAQVASGRIFRCVSKTDSVWGEGVSEKVIWCVVKEFASKAQRGNLAPHDLRRTCARLCHVAGGELEQIQFLLGHVSVQTTEKYLGCKQKRRIAVNDHIGIEPEN